MMEYCSVAATVLTKVLNLAETKVAAKVHCSAAMKAATRAHCLAEAKVHLMALNSALPKEISKEQVFVPQQLIQTKGR